mgnify:CR=1 FL=1
MEVEKFFTQHGHDEYRNKLKLETIPESDNIFEYALSGQFKSVEVDDNINYKYKENKIVADLKNYLDRTYNQHYQTVDNDNNIQCFDAWIALGDATPTFRNTALKYLWRYGKKNGNNKDDLMKALHYIVMCLYNDHYKNL